MKERPERTDHSPGPRVLNEEIPALQSYIDRRFGDVEGLRVLEAGCGARTVVTLGNRPYVVGIDISMGQLEKHEMLNGRIVADLLRSPVRASSVDAVVCWNVLEHVAEPQRALRYFVEAVKQGGVIILALPNVLSLKGLLTKFTPHSFHIWAYRHILGSRGAGPHGFPFPTVLRFSMAPGAILNFAKLAGLEVLYFKLYEHPKIRMVRQRFKITGPIWRLVKALTRVLSLGRIDADLTDYILVLRKPRRLSAAA